SRGLAGEINVIIKLSQNNPELAQQMARDIGINYTTHERLNRPARNDNNRREVGVLARELQRATGLAPEIYIEKSNRLMFIDFKRGDQIQTFATTLRRVYSSSTEVFIAFIIGAMILVSLLTTPFVIMH